MKDKTLEEVVLDSVQSTLSTATPEQITDLIRAPYEDLKGNKMDEFDYMQDDALMKFTKQFEPELSDHYTGNIADYTFFIQEEFLPRFERAVWELTLQSRPSRR